ncbi:hypothetical protein [Tellurirhabdus rosea]|uniref:hypothetical protein n=1 Tax=Tellurirhabdus rosea TaxID=2674997 RepID=UPI00224F9996|nr:hypothetical protein [Tellurirhabdus rosea]
MLKKTIKAYRSALEQTIDWARIEAEQQATARYDTASRTFIGYGRLGAVADLMPSGKLWHLGFTDGINQEEISEDLKFIAAFEQVAAKRDMYPGEGDGNPQHLYLSRTFHRMPLFGVEYATDGQQRLRVFLREKEARAFAATLRQYTVFRARFLVKVLGFESSGKENWKLAESRRDVEYSGPNRKTALYTEREDLKN